jgi:hypothetical protein
MDKTTKRTEETGSLPEDTDLAARATQCAQKLLWAAGKNGSPYWKQLTSTIKSTIENSLQEAAKAHQEHAVMTQRMRCVYENTHLLRATLLELHAAAKQFAELLLPYAHLEDGSVVPRIVAIASDLLAATEFRFSDQFYGTYLKAFQAVAPLQMEELLSLPLALQFVLMEAVANDPAASGPKADTTATNVAALRAVTQAPFKELNEELMVCHTILLQDPAGAYAGMDFDGRSLYRQVIAKLSHNSDCSEIETAQHAIGLARAAAREHEPNPRLLLRKSHVGYYLIAEGLPILEQRVQVRWPIVTQLQKFLRRHPDEFYLGGIEVLTGLFTLGILVPMIQHFDTFLAGLCTFLVLLFPCSQAAVEVMNFLITTFLPPGKLPKLDFSGAIPEDCTTMVVVPTLLLSESQVHHLAADLEIRYIGNQNRNLYFALLTDLPDSEVRPREDSPLIELAERLIRELNQKYSTTGRAPFALFHRHRIFNPREGVWMGWERKRGKLLDFNKLVLGEHDSFPIKIVDLSLLRKVRYVITLDSDTELPRGVAHRLIGTIAHPLNQAIIDPHRNLVTIGYGILQPRVGISVLSASRSRLASIYSGETGFDIYSRAVSDVYQDLYAEGIFTGKGIYEVGTFHRVLDRRFPRNALLSHDLIEGAYARVGLTSDIEVIDDYPSHYSAYNRRKHRWLRGDWQIIEWLSPRVRDESGRIIANPIRLISGWKILDNLRRSLVEPATLLFLLLGWLVLPGSPLYWTLVVFLLLFLPSLSQFVVGFARGLFADRPGAVSESVTTLGTSLVSSLLVLTFLAHQAMLSLDAILRSFYRRTMSRQRLLEWESAAQVEMGVRKRTFLDVVLDWMPVVAAAIGSLVVLLHHRALTIAVPVLFLWACSKPLSLWLNLPPRAAKKNISEKEAAFLRNIALHTWRYFAEFSSAEERWLIPDNVQLEPCHIASRLSPTNLGFLLNARQAACELGYLTLPEFADLTLKTLHSVLQLRRARGHLLNWYDTRSQEPLAPHFISTVDSGNLAASLITLKQGCLARLRSPLLHCGLYDGYVDFLRALVRHRVLQEQDLHRVLEMQQSCWNKFLLPELFESAVPEIKATNSQDALWFVNELSSRSKHIHGLIQDYEPWLANTFQPMREWFANSNVVAQGDIPLQDMPAYLDALIAAIGTAKIVLRAGRSLNDTQVESVQRQLSTARENTARLIADIQKIIEQAESLLSEMQFDFLLDPRRKLLSIGFDVDSNTLNASCYDMLGSESRIASFLAIANGDIAQETWVLLGREHVMSKGRPVLISWTGTMFEYLMPHLWMHSHQNTLLQRAMMGAVLAQQAFAKKRRVPWGISESAYSATDIDGLYQYHAFGIPELAIRAPDMERLVVAPYASILALPVATEQALQNLASMEKQGWFGRYGFYEAIDYQEEVPGKRPAECVVVRSWMAHHQGMSLLSITNLLQDNILQKYFHQDARVQACELLLHERPVLFAAKKWSG